MRNGNIPECHHIQDIVLFVIIVSVCTAPQHDKTTFIAFEFWQKKLRLEETGRVSKKHTKEHNLLFIYEDPNSKQISILKSFSINQNKIT